ncbi:unnamed protein product [Didymodactylos carnosus]|uniref:SNRNP25 ubiquitin-like domain-containing protein n=1 Tax=Didymodactylos carnosus TaxID=1234261 RepID=A0A814TQM2_9BILA|nr:unnamed protein product [Didymodactylos carnosus]CAF1163099.1 unnamed protein product [Didymodactylos carnosus]CAF3701731.1 unnamed protein product [Didymodactylos carnosus]CAF3926668.1 unnamed protein product [Didymodactylos carnosus]
MTVRIFKMSVNQLEDLTILNHQEFISTLRSKLVHLITSDPYLIDIHPDNVTVDELVSLNELEHGQAMSLNIRRFDNSIINVIISQKCRVYELKRAIKNKFLLKLQRETLTKKYPLKISWRSVWKRYWLTTIDGEKLMDNNRLVKDYGIVNKSELTFVKRKREKN